MCGTIRVSCPGYLDDVVKVEKVTRNDDNVSYDLFLQCNLGERVASDNNDEVIVTFWYDLLLYKCAGM